MKKVTILFLIFALTLSLAACGRSSEAPSGSDPIQENSSNLETQQESAASDIIDSSESAEEEPTVDDAAPAQAPAEKKATAAPESKAAASQSSGQSKPAESQKPTAPAQPTEESADSSGCESSDSKFSWPQFFLQQSSGSQGSKPQSSDTQSSKPQSSDTQNSKPQTPGSQSSSVNTDALIKQVASLVNEERAKAGLSPLTLDAALSENAEVRAGEIVQNFSHTRPDGRSALTAITSSYRSAGENIAYGQKSPEEVMNGWMNSSGHRANILNSSFTKIGVGVVESGGRLYWVQLFVG